MTIRKCSTCKHYEPAPIWRKGWCRNPLLYSPQQSHLVGEDDLDCDRGMGNYWEPIDQEADSQPTTGSYGFVAPPSTAERRSAIDEGLAPMHLRGYHGDTEGQEPQGGDVSQYGGPGRPSASGGYGSGSGDSGGGDDDRYTSPFGDSGGPDPQGSDRPPFGYQTEDRYWTDYLRIAAPVVGVILMLGLVWFWVANMLSNNDDDDVNNNDEDLSGPVIPADTPTPITIDEDETEPTAESTPEGDNEPNEEVDEDDPAPTTIGPGATVVVIGTGESGLNVRSDASTESEVLESVTDGTTLLVTGEASQADGFTWWPVDTGSVNGFVAEDFIELSE